MWTRRTATGTVRVVESDRRHGDFHLGEADPVVLERRRRALVDAAWTMLDEVHGTDVVTVDAPGAGDRRVGDVLVTDVAGAVLGVWVGDCAPVVVVTPGGRIAAAHAGWRGIVAGVLDRALDAAVGDHGHAEPGTVAYVGPSIGPCCYEFGEGDLATVAAAVDAGRAEIAGRTASGALALDVRAVVRHALARRGVTTTVSSRCTGCDHRLYSHRVRSDRGRHVVAAWKCAEVGR